MTRSAAVVSGACLWLLLLIFFIAQHVPQSPAAWQDTDSGAYIERALIIKQTGRLANTLQEELPHYTLGYPLLLAAILKVVSSVPLSAMLLNLVALLLLVFFVVGALRRYFSDRATIAALPFLLFNTGLVTFSLFILTELSVAAAAAAALYFLVDAYQTQKPFLWFCTGLAFAYMTLLKPAPFFTVIALAFLLTTWGFWRLVAAFISGYVLLVGLYVCLVLQSFGAASLVRMADVNWFLYFYPNVRAAVFGTMPYVERRRVVELSTDPAAALQLKHDAQKFLLDHPATTLRVWLLNCIKTSFGLYSTNLKRLLDPSVGSWQLSFFSKQGSFVRSLNLYLTQHTQYAWQAVVAYAELIMLLLSYFLAAGFCLFLFKHDIRFALLLIFFVGSLIGVTGHDGCARFRMMIEPVLIFAAAGGYCVIFGHSKKTQRKI